MRTKAYNEWMEKGTFLKVDNQQIFVIDTGCSEINPLNSKPVLCILHGFPTSSFDYWKVIDKLAEQYRVVIHDHVGFGFSDKPVDYAYSLIDQTDIALCLWKQLNIESAIILAHDYGASIATELLARVNVGLCPIKIQQLVLCNGSMHIELAKLRLMQKLLRNRFIGKFIAKISNRKILGRNLRNIYFDQSKISQNEIDTIWSMMIYNNGRDVLAKVSRYTFERQKLWHRWIGALKQMELPIKIVWPKNDPIAVAEMANVIKNETKNSKLIWLEDVGHFPMLEKPECWATRYYSQLITLFESVIR